MSLWHYFAAKFYCVKDINYNNNTYTTITTTNNNRSHVETKDKKEENYFIIDTTSQSDKTISFKEYDKIRKCKDVLIGIESMWNYQTTVMRIESRHWKTVSTSLHITQRMRWSLYSLEVYYLCWQTKVSRVNIVIND